MQSPIKRVEIALQQLKQGKMILLIDDPDRENEGDLIVAAESITPEIMNFMIRNGTGIVCLPLSPALLEKLQLPLMVPPHENSCARGTQFTISIDAATDITTGVSAADRVKTVLAAIQDQVCPHDIVKPGHIFPLLAKPQGVLERPGHTEGAIDLVTLAGFKAAAVLCEVMNPDGTMARGEKLHDFAIAHQLPILSISDLITYRLQHENLMLDQASTTLSLEKYGTFKMTVVKDKLNELEHVVLYKENRNAAQPPLVRLHSSCMTGDLFSSTRCDCHQQLHHSLQRISEEGGMLIYLSQEGRGIGLLNKIKTYALQDQGLDTVEANLKLGLPIDPRNYAIAANILRDHQFYDIRLLTNNPHKITDLKKYGITKVTRETMPTFQNKNNQFYLQTKKDKLQHVIEMSI